jgi:hypothetical protein
MRLSEIKSNILRTYALRVRLPQQGYTNIIDLTVQARTPEMARRLVKNLYGPSHKILSQPREIKN